jgi:very-long-chain enoyl-CoA reductase
VCGFRGVDRRPWVATLNCSVVTVFFRRCDLQENKMVLVNFKARGKISGLPSNLEVSSSAKVEEVVKLLSTATSLSVHRLRLTMSIPDAKPAEGFKKKPELVLQPSNQIGDFFGTEDSINILVKDLGPQISWTTVFVIEYFGPLFIHPLFYFAQKLVYGGEFDHSQDQFLVFGFVMLHYLKREFETLFVHRFSLATMPARNIVKNSAHYWILSGVSLAYFVYAPRTYGSGGPFRFLFSRQGIVPLDEFTIMVLSGVWMFAELSNFKTHMILCDLRPVGSTERKIPYGYGFDLVSCPNYFFEYLAWLMVLLITQNVSVLVFLVVATGQMWVWAVKKHRRYRKDFPDYPRNRKVMFPFLF